MMQSFKKRVIAHLLKDGWNIKHSALPYIDFFSVRRGARMKKAYRVRSHGHLSHKEQNVLYEYGKQTGIHVLYVHEVADREIEFVRLYPRSIKEAGKRNA